MMLRHQDGREAKDLLVIKKIQASYCLLCCHIAINQRGVTLLIAYNWRYLCALMATIGTGALHTVGSSMGWKRTISNPKCVTRNHILRWPCWDRRQFLCNNEQCITDYHHQYDFKQQSTLRRGVPTKADAKGNTNLKHINVHVSEINQHHSFICWVTPSTIALDMATV